MHNIDEKKTIYVFLVVGFDLILNIVVKKYYNTFWSANGKEA